MGNLSKIIIEFESVFWDKKSEFIYLIPMEDDYPKEDEGSLFYLNLYYVFTIL
jgi:hypothetical protein